LRFAEKITRFLIGRSSGNSWETAAADIVSPVAMNATRQQAPCLRFGLSAPGSPGGNYRPVAVLDAPVYNDGHQGKPPAASRRW
jgi:hypothetical protein